MTTPAARHAPDAATKDAPAYTHLPLEWGGVDLELLPAGAVHWPAARTLFVADTHFGKAAAYRTSGVYVPAGTTDRTLGKLSDLVDATDAARIVILGDFLHAKQGRTEPVLDALRAWRNDRPDLELTLVRGNHDDAAGDPPADLRIDVLDPGARLDPFTLAHIPAETPDPDAFTLAGHIHAYVILQDADGSMLPMRCFVVRPTLMILPAFGSFTGGGAYLTQQGDRIVVIDGNDFAKEVRVVPRSRAVPESDRNRFVAAYGDANPDDDDSPSSASPATSESSRSSSPSKRDG